MLLMASALTGSLAACTAALDWRELRPDGWALSAALPCKPVRQQRSVVLAGAPVALSLLACKADGHTFALASCDVADPARVGPTLQVLAQAAVANVQGRVESEQPAAVPGMTPNPASRRWRLRGQLPDGQAVAEQVLVFAHGTRVFQATLIGSAADDARAQPFFEAIRVLR